MPLPNIDVRPGDTFALAAPTYIDARVLAANAAESVPIPAGARFAFFSATADFYARYGGTAAVPSGDVADGTASELNPTQRFVGGVTSLSLIAPSPCTVTVAWYQ